MRNIKLVLEYDGTNYHGWQKQPNQPTIQGTVEDALSKLTKTRVQIIGAGRTDTGVHAEGQVANFHLAQTTVGSEKEKIDARPEIPLVAFQKGLNTILPRDIVILAATEVPSDFHARFSATSRRYRYTILNRAYPSALSRHRCYFYPAQTIDISRADALCANLVGKQDFSAFRRTGSDRLNPMCEIYEAACWKAGEHVYFEIEADSFLRGMVRAIVGTILKYVNCENVPAELRRIIKAKDRAAAGPSVPAHGLSLIRVTYGNKP